MIKHLLIAVLVSQNDVEATVKNISEFCLNTVEHGPFDQNEDQFVIYLEDLYPRTNSPTQVVERALITFFTKHPHIKYKITNNQIREIIPEFCMKEALIQTTTDKSIPMGRRAEMRLKIIATHHLENDAMAQHLLFKRIATQESSDPAAFKLYQSNLPEYLNLFYKIAQIAVAPTLIKELIQPFCLHYESAIEPGNCVTVYCDLDMRYDTESTPSSLRTYYLSISHSMPTLREVGGQDELVFQHDVFWALHNGDQDPVFLVCFYNILYFTICHTYWKKEITGTDSSDSDSDIDSDDIRSEIELLKLLIRNRNALFEDYLRPERCSTTLFTDRRLQFARTNGDRLNSDPRQYADSLYKIRAIINLHFGRVRVRPFTEISKDLNEFLKNDLVSTHFLRSYYPNFADHLPAFNSFFITRAPLFCLFFMPAYKEPFSRYFQLNRIKKQPGYPASSSGNFMFPNASPAFGFMSARHNTNSEWYNLFYSSVLKVKKRMFTRWARIPMLSAQDMKEIIPQYPFMYDVLLVTMPLRDLAVNYNKDDPEGSIKYFLEGQLQLITSVIINKNMKKQFPHELKLRLYPNPQMPGSPYLEAARPCVICGTLNTKKCPECGAVICAMHNKPQISEYMCHMSMPSEYS